MKPRIQVRFWCSAVAATAMALTVVACGDDDDDTPSPTEDQAAVRVVHAAPDAPAVDIYVEGRAEPIIEDLSYGEVSSYAGIDIGAQTLELRPAGALASTTPIYSTSPLTLRRGDEITAVAAGLLSSEDTEAQFRVLPLAEDFGTPAAGNARVRIVHVSPDAPSVAVDVLNDGSPEIEALERFGETGATGVDLPADTKLQLGIWAGDPLERVTAFTTPALDEGEELFLIATGRVGAKPREPDGFAILAVGPQGRIELIRQNPFVYALHASPDAPAVDVFAGGSELADNLSFAGLSGRLQVPPGEHTLDFFAHAEGATRPPGQPAATASTAELDAGERYLVIATGFLAATGSNPEFQLLEVAEQFERAGDESRVRFVHAAPDVPAIDIGPITAGTLLPIWEDVEFGETTEIAGTTVPAADLTVGAAVAGSTEPLVSFDVPIGAGAETIAVAIGSMAVGNLQLVLVDTLAPSWMAAAVPPNQDQ